MRNASVVILGMVIALSGPFLAAQNGTDCKYDPQTPRAGCLDTAFGGGWVISNDQPSGGLGHAVFQGDKIVVGGTALSRWTLARYDAAGKLDKSFGSNGYAQLPVKRAYSGEGLWGLRIQPIGGENYILATGNRQLVGGSWGIARFKPSGQQDLTFGDPRYDNLVLPFGTSKKYTSGAGDIAVQFDGKIVSVGQYKTQLAVVRLLANGNFDTSFGSGGKFFSTNLSGSARAVTFQTVGGQQAILVGGSLVDQTDPQKKRLPSLLRLTPTGQLDQTFGNGGIASLPVAAQGSDNQFLSVVVIDAPMDQDRKIIAVGEVREVGTDYYRLVIARFDSYGILESTFNDFVPPCANSVGWDLAIQPVVSDYKLIVAGNCTFAGASSASAAMWRFKSDGSLDDSFGYHGAVITDVNGNGGGIEAIIQADGKFVVAGGAVVSKQWRFAVARYVE